MELNHKLSVHYTTLGEYPSEEKLVEHIEDVIMATLERELHTEVGVNVSHEDTPLAFFSCMYEHEGNEILIPFATRLRGVEAIGEYQTDYGYAPDDATLIKVYNITEQQFTRYSRNRDILDPMKMEYGSTMKYYRLSTADGSLLAFFGSKRMFRKEEAVIAHAIEIGKVGEGETEKVEMGVGKDEYVKHRYGVKLGVKNTHYVVKETYTDGRDTEYLASLATKIKFKDLDQVKTHMIEIGKIKSEAFDSDAKLEKITFRDYTSIKKKLEARTKVKKMTESQAEAFEYTDDMEDDDWS
jgi:hypothetical protein